MLETLQLAWLQSLLIASAGSWVKAQVVLKRFTGFLCRGVWEHPGCFQSFETFLLWKCTFHSCHRLFHPELLLSTTGNPCGSHWDTLLHLLAYCASGWGQLPVIKEEAYLWLSRWVCLLLRIWVKFEPNHWFSLIAPTGNVHLSLRLCFETTVCR